MNTDDLARLQAHAVQLEARATRLNRLVFGGTVVYVAALAVLQAFGRPLEWPTWALAFVLLGNATVPQLALPPRTRLVVARLSAGLNLAVLAAIVVDALW